MSRRPLCHLLYTNAPGEGSVGFRVLSSNFKGSPDEQRTIQDWLMGLKLVEGQQYGWAVHGFSVDRSPCFALALVDRSSFAHDEHGREGGFLAHALLVLLEEGKPAGDFGLALFDRARSFLQDRSGPPTLDDYMKGVKVVTDLEVPELELNNFRGLDQRFLDAFYPAACAGGNGEVFLPGYTSEDLPEHLLAASLALPPRLRLALSWRVGLRPGEEGFVARVSQAESPSPPIGNLGTAYLEAVRAQMRAGYDQRLARFAATDWGVRQWSGLQQALVRPEAEESHEVVAASTPDPDPFQGSDDMAKKSSATGNAPAAASPKRGKGAAEFEAEYQAIQKQLQDYFDQRLGQLGAPPAQGSASTPAYVAPGEGGESGWTKWRPEIYFFILLLLGGWAFWYLRQATPPNPQAPPPANLTSTFDPEESEIQEAQTQAKTETQAETQPLDPLAAWKSFVESPAAIQWFQDIADGHGLETRQVSDTQRALFRRLATLRSQGKQLDADGLVASRIGSFEYVHARWASANDLSNPAEDVVTQNPSEAARNLERLVSSLGLAKPLGSEPSVKDPKVQAEVVLAWIHQNVSP